jgi:hypothetical protein
VLINVLPDVRLPFLSGELCRIGDGSLTLAEKGLTGNLTTAECQELGFAAAIYPCTGFIPAMLAMQESYRGLKEEGSDLKYCQGKTIVNFFEQLGLKEAMKFDEQIESWSRDEVEHNSKQLES